MARRIGLTLIHLLIATISMGIIAFAFYSAVVSSPPVVWSGNEVWPTQVRAGETVAVTRTFNAIRREVIDVERDLETIPCTRRQCVRYVMPESSFTVEPMAEPRTLTRYHQIPINVPPGEYTLAFEIQWVNFFGKKYSDKLPPLRVTVIP